MNEKLIAEARDCLHIRQISLNASQLALHQEFDPTVPGSWGIQFRISLKRTDISSVKEGQPKRVRGVVEAGVRLVPAEQATTEDAIKEGASSPVAAELTGTFFADYECSVGKEISAEAANEFLKHNAVFHVWSYWREYVQSMFARALLPSVTLPMMVISPSSSVPAKEE